MDSPRLMQCHDQASADPGVRRREGARALAETAPSFHQRFVDLFDALFPRVYRFLNRLSGEPELAADIAQETFVRLYQKGSLPDSPEAWLISVALNLYRNETSTRSRRRRLLTAAISEPVGADPPPSLEQASAQENLRRRVRSTLDRLSERERGLLLLRAEGYNYRELATVLGLNEASVGALLARARRAFREAYEDAFHAPG